jgi:hypothetical protein
LYGIIRGRYEVKKNSGLGFEPQEKRPQSLYLSRSRD